MIKNVSIIIPAYNEGKLLPSTVKNIKKVLEEFELSYEIILVNNNSTDSTEDIARELGCEVVNQSVRNIGKTRNAGAKIAKYDTLLFIDADTKITNELLGKAFKEIINDKDNFNGNVDWNGNDIENIAKNPNTKSNNEQKVYAVSTITKFDTYPTLSSRGVWLYNIFSYFFKLGVAQFILINKTVFEELNGFDEEFFAFEEIDFFKRLKNKYGRNKLKVLWEPVISSSRKFKDKKSCTGKFLLLLLASILGKPVGKDKSNLEFWYGDKCVEKYPWKKYLAFLVLNMLFFNLILKFLEINTFEYASPIITPILFLMMSLLLIETKIDIYYFFLITILTIIIEFIGVKTGLPFGNYSYNPEYYKVGVLGIPIFIGFAWYVIGASVARITRSFWKSIISIIFIDIILELFATKNGLWTWYHDGIFTAPLINYLSWGIIGGLVYLIVKKQTISLFLCIFLYNQFINISNY